MRTYCIIGDPVSHSLSPAMHNAAFKSLSLDDVYIAYRVSSHELESAVESLRSVKISGFNVTIPHKTAVLKYLDEVDLMSRKAGAVNTVASINGKFKGFNTDIQGFIQPLVNRNIDFKGLSVLLFGAGGSARAVVTSLSSVNGISKLVVANRTYSKSMELSKLADLQGLSSSVSMIEEAKGMAKHFDLIVNATSVGLQSNESILDSEDIDESSTVYDLVYRPIMTKLLENARKKGAGVVYGYEMLLEQGAQAFEIWTGLKAPFPAMKKALFGVFQEPK
ncbi:MAG: shikimate dehydrogenase [Nitrososphaeraceae archaeon]